MANKDNISNWNRIKSSSNLTLRCSIGPMTLIPASRRIETSEKSAIESLKEIYISLKFNLSKVRNYFQI